MAICLFCCETLIGAHVVWDNMAGEWLEYGFYGEAQYSIYIISDNIVSEGGALYTPFISFQQLYDSVLLQTVLDPIRYSSGSWILARSGDIVSKDSIQAQNTYLFNGNGETSSNYDIDYSITLNQSGMLYLAFFSDEYVVDRTAVEYTISDIVGWVEVLYDEYGTGLSIGRSAYDLDGGPMIVGGGSAIPEPSGVLLIVVGIAVLLLRRSTTPIPVCG